MADKQSLQQRAKTVLLVLILLKIMGKEIAVTWGHGSWTAGLGVVLGGDDDEE